MSMHLDFLSQTAVTAQWRALADLTLKGAIVLTAAWTLTLTMRRASAAMRHLVWTLAIFGILALPVLAARLPGWRILPVWMNWEPSSAQPIALHARGPAIVGAIPRTFSPPQGFATAAPALDGRMAIALQAAERSRSALPPTAASPSALRSTSTAKAAERPASAWTQVSWQSWMLIAWGCGTAVMLLPVLASLLGLWRLGRAPRIEGGSWDLLLQDLTARLKLPRSVMLLRGRPQAMPMTWGIVRPKLLLPPEADGWPMDRRRVVLIHELAHIRRCDFLTQLIVHIARAIYWFNPLIWIASRQIAIESEGACDDLVVSQETKPSDYAEHLLTVVARLQQGALIPVAAIAMARSSKLEARLVGILDDKRNRRSLTAAGVVLASAMVISGILPLAMLRAARGQDSKTTAANPKPIHAADSPAPAKAASAPKDDTSVEIDSPGSVALYNRAPAGDRAAPVQPVPIVFSIPQDAVQSVVRKFDAHQTLIVDVYDGRDAAKRLGHGSLVGIDNQINEQTGMLKCKAVVTPIGDALLFPNQFVNVRLILEAKAGATADANRDVLKVELQQAKTQADRLGKAFQAGAASHSEFQVARDKVEELEAELTGDIAQVRKVKLAAAQRRLQTAALLLKANALSASEYDQAKNEVDVLEAELANDPVRIARVKLDYAMRRLETATILHNAGALTAVEFENAKAEADIAEARLRALPNEPNKAGGADPNESNKARGADPGKKEGAAAPSTKPRTMEVKLDAARRELDITTKRFEAGLIGTLEFQEAKDKVRILEAELTGDAVRVAEAKLAAARAQLQISETQHNAGLMTELDLEKAKSHVAIAEAELRVVAEKAAEKPAQSRPANEGTTKPAAASPKTAAERAAAMKADIRNFKLDLQYNGAQDKPYYRLRLSVAPIAVKHATLFDLQVQITEEQARKIIDHLAADGFLTAAHDLTAWGFIPKAAQPGYSMTVMNYYSDLGWKLPMLKRLDALRSALEGDAGKSMDLLLGRLSGERKQWTPGAG